MAKALKCDRCGKFFCIDDMRKLHDDDEFVYYVVKSLYSSSRDNMYDICPNCYEQLKAWMEGRVGFIKEEPK